MTNAFYTHRPYLQKELDILLNHNPKEQLNILELGVGDGSSELFHRFARSRENISILGLETNARWANKMKEKYQLSNYTIQYIESWNIDIYNNLSNKFYDLVFIDQSPWSARIESLDYFSNKGLFRTAILHDYNYYNIDHKCSIDSESFFFKYANKYNLISFCTELPPTLILQSKE